jgi:putative endonuclease
MYTFYVIQSIPTGKLYKGHTADIDLRLKHHNQGKTRSTKSGRPWKVIHIEEFKTRQEAIEREKESKTRKGGRELHKLLGL